MRALPPPAAFTALLGQVLAGRDRCVVGRLHATALLSGSWPPIGDATKSRLVHRHDDGLLRSPVHAAQPVHAPRDNPAAARASHCHMRLHRHGGHDDRPRARGVGDLWNHLQQRHRVDSTLHVSHPSQSSGRLPAVLFCSPPASLPPSTRPPHSRAASLVSPPTTLSRRLTRPTRPAPPGADAHQDARHRSVCRWANSTHTRQRGQHRRRRAGPGSARLPRDHAHICWHPLLRARVHPVRARLHSLRQAC